MTTFCKDMYVHDLAHSNKIRISEIYSVLHAQILPNVVDEYYYCNYYMKSDYMTMEIPFKFISNNVLITKLVLFCLLILFVTGFSSLFNLFVALNFIT